jgi:hypothetical protein
LKIRRPSAGGSIVVRLRSALYSLAVGFLVSPFGVESVFFSAFSGGVELAADGRWSVE